jgi:hypothetical protein
MSKDLVETKVLTLPKCGICKVRNAQYDGQTQQGPWAYMCEACFQIHGIGLGLGKGQRLILVEQVIKKT